MTNQDSEFTVPPPASVAERNVMQLYADIWKRSSTGPAVTEIVRLRNARTVNCSFRKSVRYDASKDDGLTDQMAESISAPNAGAQLSDKQRAAVAFADVYLLDPTGMTSENAAYFRKHFSGRELGHMAVALASFNAGAKSMIASGHMPQVAQGTELVVDRIFARYLTPA